MLALTSIIDCILFTNALDEIIESSKDLREKIGFRGNLFNGWQNPYCRIRITTQWYPQLGRTVASIVIIDTRRRRRCFILLMIMLLMMKNDKSSSYRPTRRAQTTKSQYYRENRLTDRSYRYGQFQQEHYIRWYFGYLLKFKLLIIKKINFYFMLIYPHTHEIGPEQWNRQIVKSFDLGIVMALPHH